MDTARSPPVGVLYTIAASLNAADVSAREPYEDKQGEPMKVSRELGVAGVANVILEHLTARKGKR
jgi:hypothetical protein